MSRKPIRATIRFGGEPQDGADALRDAFSRWLSGVTIVAARADGRVHGMTVSAFVPVSLEPPLLLVSLAADAPVLSAIEEAGRFVVNVLAEPQRGLANRFADRFPVGPAPFAAEGDPVLEGALASFACALEEIRAAGDHRLVLGRIERVEVVGEGSPLGYYEREYRRVV
jgi:flavin reductase (NADH)